MNQLEIISEWEKEEEELRDKGNCQNLKKKKINVEERGWEKHQEVLESGRTSLVHVCSCEFTGLCWDLDKRGKSCLSPVFSGIQA